MKKRVKEMEDEAKKIEDLQTNAEKALKPKTAPGTYAVRCAHHPLHQPVG